MIGWEEVEIQDLGRVVTGKTPPTGEREYFDGPYKFVSPKDMDFDSRYIHETLTTITDKSIKKFKNQVLPRNAVMFTSLSYGFGKIGLASNVCLTNQQINTIIVNEEKHDYNFVYYLLRYSKDRILSYNAGIVTPIIPKSLFEKIKVFVPISKATQQKIGSILSAYDDLIENNLKRIKLLEELAQRTYEEWFVKFIVKGEKLPLNEETGLPEGWERKKLAYLCEKIADGTHDSPKQSENGYKLITGKHLMKGYIDFESAYLINEEDHLKIKKRSGLEKFDVLFSNIGTLGNVAMVNEDFEYSCKNMIIFRPQKGKEFYLFSYLLNKNNKDRFIGQSSGSTQKFVSLKYIRSFEDIIPSEPVLLNFNNSIKPIYLLIFKLHAQNRLLKESRDLLLPRLMSGKLPVEAAETQLLSMAAEPEVQLI